MRCRRANLSNEVQAWFEEVALDEQGHVRCVPPSTAQKETKRKLRELLSICAVFEFQGYIVRQR